MTGSDTYDRCGYDIRQLHPSCTAYRTANLPVHQVRDKTGCHFQRLETWQRQQHQQWLKRLMQLLRGESFMFCYYSDDAKYKKLSDIVKITTGKRTENWGKIIIQNRIRNHKKCRSNGSSNSLPKIGKDTKKRLNQYLQICMFSILETMTWMYPIQTQIYHSLHPYFPLMTNSVI